MASLAGCGRSGNWSVDIDNEESSSDDEIWSVTFNSPFLTLQTKVRSLAVLKDMNDYLSGCAPCPEPFRLFGSSDIEILIWHDGLRLFFRTGRPQVNHGKSFPWLLECVVDVSEGKELATATGEALMECET